MHLSNISTVVVFASLLGFGWSHYPVGYQIHSNNDLDEWDQLFIKGATRFKVDIHFMKQGINCLDKGYDTECFLLSHDTPNSEGVMYNTSDELVSYLTNDCQALRSTEDNIVVSLCFKSAPDKCDDTSEAFASWLEMVDSLYNTLTLNPPIGVQFVLDGDAKPENCLVGKWENWDSVWIQGSSPDDALYSNAGEYARFQILNDREGRMDWYKLAQEDYGKFTNSTSPYHLWEPDSQSDFHEYIKIYQSGKEHPPGFCFAINIDIAMFDVYTTSTTDLELLSVDRNTPPVTSAVNVKLVNDESASHPRIVSLSHNESSLSESFLYLYQDNTATLKYSTLATSRPAKLDQPIPHYQADEGVLPLPNSSWIVQSDNAVVVGLSASSQSIGANQHQHVLVTASSGRYCLYTTSVSDDAVSELHVEVCGIFSDIGDTVFDAVLTKCGLVDSEALCALVLTTTSDPTKVQLNTYTCFGPVDTNNVGDEEDLCEVSAVTIGIDDLEISSARIGIGNDNIFIFSSVDNHILATSAPLLKLDNFSISSHSSWKTIGVGNSMDVSVGAGGVLMLVTDYGYCYNSHKHNTRSTEKVCSSVPMPSEHVLDYFIGLEADWAAHLASAGDNSRISTEINISVQDSDHYITPCHHRLMHGSFDQGSRPSVALSVLPAPLPVLFLELHEGLARHHRSDGGCGNPLHRGGLILDSFPIDHWVKKLEKSV